MRIRDPASMSGREVFTQVTWNSASNVLWYGLAAVVIAIIGKAVWWWLGVVLFGAFALIFVAGSIHTFIGVIMGLVLTPATIYAKLRGQSIDLTEQWWLGAGTAIQLVEITVLAAYTFWLYRMFF